MIESRRRAYNRDWTPAKYERFRAILTGECGEGQQFRHSETPCFFTSALIDRMSRYGIEMVEQLLGDARYMNDSAAAVPDLYRVPNEAPAPLFVQADFGLDQNLDPKLVEIQGFPSLYSYQPLLSLAYREAFAIDPELHPFPGALTLDRYWELLRTAIVAGHDPENVVLMEVDPWHQKTRHDFQITEKMLGVRAVDIREIHKEGNRLLYSRDGRLVPIHRIYNRTIIDELERRGIQPPFDFRDDLDVEWAGHPNWFFRLSKFSLPYFTHSAVPKTRFLGDAFDGDAFDIDDPAHYVLKPLFSFAGVGVIVGPTKEQIAAIPEARRNDYILQERVDFRPVIDTPAGMTKVEVRIMYIWTGGKLEPVNTVIRMGRGAQMGVDFNKGFEWVGASAAFIDSIGETP